MHPEEGQRQPPPPESSRFVLPSIFHCTGRQVRLH
jgi:hypothetical protein